jgi:glycosidase
MRKAAGEWIRRNRVLTPSPLQVHQGCGATEGVRKNPISRRGFEEKHGTIFKMFFKESAMPEPDAIHSYLMELYGKETGDAVYKRLCALIDHYRALTPGPQKRQRGVVTQRDAILITYGDQVLEPAIPPLGALAGFCERRLQGLVSGIHILPFYPFSSDDGFSVMDYKAVNPDLGSWEDLSAFRRSFRLMFDAVINHISVQNEWFSAFLRGDPKYNEYFISVDGSPDLSQVARPRALPLLTEFNTSSGRQAIWTTFSTDQVDLNYHNPDVLLDILDVLLFYATQGAEFIRLDAIAYLWKETGTSCIHLPQTHQMIRLFRAVLDSVFPQVLLITETNVPHRENISYFGDGTNEAQLVYNFALPPLVLHALHTGQTHALSEWARHLKLPAKTVTFFNFLASHDGIGLNPARGILTDAEIDALIARVQAHGGRVSYKNNPDGSQIAYELNINYFDALSDPHSGEALEVQVDRFMVAQAIMLALAGVPGIYFHSLFGSRGWPEGVQLTQQNRTINRQKLDRPGLEQELQDPASRRYRVFQRFSQMLTARASSAAFHPYGGQEILSGGDPRNDGGSAIFALLRVSPDGRQRVLCLHNLSNTPQAVSLDWQRLLKPEPVEIVDLITGRTHQRKPAEAWLLSPYEVNWLGWND